jgi:hypothetical protein
MLKQATNKKNTRCSILAERSPGIHSTDRKTPSEIYFTISGVLLSNFFAIKSYNTEQEGGSSEAR